MPIGITIHFLEYIGRFYSSFQFRLKYGAEISCKFFPDDEHHFSKAGTYRVNKVKEGGEDGIRIECSPSDSDDLPGAFIDYEEQPREYTLSTVTTTIDVQTRISDLYRSPMDQVREQLGVLIEMVKERQENELVNNASYGLYRAADRLESRSESGRTSALAKFADRVAGR